MQAKMTCRMFRPFSGTFSLACLGPSSWQQKCIGPSGSCNEPPRKQGRPVRRKQRQDGTDFGQLALRTQAAFGARACRRLPKALASHGPAAAWSALAGHDRPELSAPPSTCPANRPPGACRPPRRARRSSSVQRAAARRDQARSAEIGSGLSLYAQRR